MNPFIIVQYVKKLSIGYGGYLWTKTKIDVAAL